MERWIIDVNSERYSNNASIQRLSECLDKEKLYRMKSDVTREIVGKEREKIEESYVELENQCKQLEIDSSYRSCQNTAIICHSTGESSMDSRTRNDAQKER